MGHGHQHLSTVMTPLMMLAFLIDQRQLRCCAVFNQALEGAQSRSRLWRKMAMLFDGYLITSWEHLYGSIAHGLQAAPLIPKQPP